MITKRAYLLAGLPLPPATNGGQSDLQPTANGNGGTDEVDAPLDDGTAMSNGSQDVFCGEQRQSDESFPEVDLRRDGPPRYVDNEEEDFSSDGDDQVEDSRRRFEQEEDDEEAFDVMQSSGVRRNSASGGRGGRRRSNQQRRVFTGSRRRSRLHLHHRHHFASGTSDRRRRSVGGKRRWPQLDTKLDDFHQSSSIYQSTQDSFNSQTYSGSSSSRQSSSSNQQHQTGDRPRTTTFSVAMHDIKETSSLWNDELSEPGFQLNGPPLLLHNPPASTSNLAAGDQFGTTTTISHSQHPSLSLLTTAFQSSSYKITNTGPIYSTNVAESTNGPVLTDLPSLTISPSQRPSTTQLLSSPSVSLTVNINCQTSSSSNDYASSTPSSTIHLPHPASTTTISSTYNESSVATSISVSVAPLATNTQVLTSTASTTTTSDSSTTTVIYFVCEVCTSRYRSTAGLRYHYHSQHSGYTPKQPISASASRMVVPVGEERGIGGGLRGGRPRRNKAGSRKKAAKESSSDQLTATKNGSHGNKHSNAASFGQTGKQQQSDSFKGHHTLASTESADFYNYHSGGQSVYDYHHSVFTSDSTVNRLLNNHQLYSSSFNPSGSSSWPPSFGGGPPPGYHRGDPYSSAAVRANCVYCGTNSRQPLLRCAGCDRHWHTGCAGLSSTTALSYQQWECVDCKTCSLCRSPEDKHRFIVCTSCDRAYHTYCLPPNTLTTATASCWICDICLHPSSSSAQQQQNHVWASRQQHVTSADNNEMTSDKLTTLH